MADVLGALGLPRWVGEVWSLLGGLSFVGLLFWYLFACHRPFEAELEQRLGLTILPFHRLQGRRRARHAAARRQDLARDLSRGSLTSSDLLDAAAIGLPAARTMLTSLMTEATRAKGPRTIEVYADRGQGLSILLAQTTQALARRRPVLYGSWRSLERYLSNDSVSPLDLLRIRWEVTFHRAPFPGWFRAPWFVIDDCPVRPVGLEPDSIRSFARLLSQLERAGIPYVIGVRRYRLDPSVEDHRGWVASHQQFRLALDDADAVAIAGGFIGLMSDHSAIVPREWCRENRPRYKRQLFAMLALLSSELMRQPDSDDRHFRPLVQEFDRLSPEDQAVVKWIALGQLLDVSLPEAVVHASVDARFAARVASCYEGLIRRDVGRDGRVVYHLGGPVLAYYLLRSELRSEDALVAFITGRMDANSLLTEQGVNYWRFVLHRLLQGWNPSLGRANPQRVARRAYLPFADRLTPPASGDHITRIAWAALFRRLGDTDRARQIYQGLWAERTTPLAELGLFGVSLMIGLRDVLPKIMTDGRFVGAACELARSHGLASTRRANVYPRQALALASLFIDVVRLNDGRLGAADRERLLASGEELARAASRGRYARSARNVLARLVGGLAGAYTNDAGASRPDFAEALQHVDLAFESGRGLADDDNRKTWQDVISHSTKASIYLAEYDRTGRYLDEAEWHFERSFFGVLERDIAERATLVRQYVLGCTNFAYFKWKRRHDHESADHWYRESIRCLENLSPEERPREAAELYWNYAVFLGESAGSHLAVIDVLTKALERPTVDRRRAIVAWLSSACTNACHAKLRDGQIVAAQELAREAVKWNRQRLVATDARSGEGGTIAHHLVSLLFPARVPVRDKVVIASAVVDDVVKVLSGEVARHGASGSDEALRGAVALVDVYRQYVADETVSELRRQVEAVATAPAHRQAIHAQLTAWLQEKRLRGWPCAFNESLLTCLETRTNE
jgi:hypothetical protein